MEAAERWIVEGQGDEVEMCVKAWRGKKRGRWTSEGTGRVERRIGVKRGELR